jgi:hypothetical protein
MPIVDTTSYCFLGLSSDSEDGGSASLRNASELKANYKTLHPNR